MKTFNFSVTDAQDKALQYVAVNPNEWIKVVVHDRARIAIEDISKICVEQCLANGIQIPGSKEAMVDLAFQNGWVITAVQRQASMEAEQAARQAEEAGGN